jgi:hypothetical protein
MFTNLVNESQPIFFFDLILALGLELQRYSKRPEYLQTVYSMEESAVKKQRVDPVEDSESPNLLLHLPRDLKQSIFATLCDKVRFGE